MDVDLDTWIPLGPIAVLKGQAVHRPIVSGRVNGLAFGQTSASIYAATANGGVWHSENGGVTWTSLMEWFDQNPTSSASDSLACGAIAVFPDGGDGANDRIYLGSGEPYGGQLHYFGVGPLVCNDGRTWVGVDDGHPLKGAGFWRMRVDPNDKESVVAATTKGVFMRTAGGGPVGTWAKQTLSVPAHWAAPDVATGVAVARTPGPSGSTVFYVAGPSNPPNPGATPPPPPNSGGCWRWDSSTPGAGWVAMLDGWPGTGVRTVALAMKPDDPTVIYALLSDTNGLFKSVLRLETTGAPPHGTWREVTHTSSAQVAQLFGDPSESPPHGQGYYDLAISVNPTNVNRVYLGGSLLWADTAWGAALLRCDITVDTTAHTVSMSATSIGQHVHPDLHALEMFPGDGDHLAVGGDGGVFSTDNASGAASFVSHNGGLSTLEVVRMGLHPTEAGVLYAGTQDNGTVRYTGGAVWEHVGDGDGGAVLVNPRDPRNILRGYVRKSVEWATDGAQDISSFHSVDVPIAASERVMFYPPIVGAPYDPAHSADADADLVAFGSERVWLSRDFGKSWHSIPNDDLRKDRVDGDVLTSSATVAYWTATTLAARSRTWYTDHGKLATALVFASPTKLFVGTLAGSVYRYSYDGSAWTVKALNTTDMPHPAIVAIALDPSVTTGDAIYAILGGVLGTDANKRVMHCVYDATLDTSTWTAAGGPPVPVPPPPPSLFPSPTLLDIHHSALVADPDHPDHLYIAADIGIWYSHDSGQHWIPCSVGLPDAAVIDLKIHAGKRLIFGGTHGRGVYYRTLDAPDGLGASTVRLLVRDTQLDTRYTRLFDPTQAQSVAGGVDPTSRKGRSIEHGTSPDIRVDMPDSAGHYSTNSTTISPVQFERTLSAEKEAHAYVPGSGTATNRVYVQVHNRGSRSASQVTITLLLAAGDSPPDLTTDNISSIRAGTPITTGTWRTVGTVTLPAPVTALAPGIAEFDLPADTLRGHDDWCLLAIASYPGDPSDSDNAANVQYNQLPSDAPTQVQTLCANQPIAAYKALTTTSSPRSGPGFLHRAATGLAHVLDMLPFVNPVPSDDDPAAADINPDDT